MSKVDLKVFEDILEKCEGGATESLAELVYFMCSGDIEECVPWNGGYEDWKKDCKKFLEDIPYTHLEQEGGGEGGSEYCYGVFQLGDKIYRAEYSYYSYNGHEYDYILDTLEEVKPVEKTITTYEPI